MKTNDVLNMQAALTALAAIKLPVKTAYRISKGLGKVNQVATRAQKAQNALFMARGVLNHQTGQWQVGKVESDALNTANDQLRDTKEEKADHADHADNAEYYDSLIAIAQRDIDEKQAALTAVVSAFQAEIEAIMNEEVDIQFMPVHISELGEVSIEPQHLAALDGFILTDVAETEEA